MKTRQAPLVLLALALGAGAGTAEAQTQPTQPAQPQNPLAILVVPRAALGKAAANLQIELISGATTNARAADDSFDPNDTAASVTKAGRVTGFTLLYGDVGYTALRQGKGLIDLGTSIDLFKTAGQTAAYERKSVRATRVGGRDVSGVVIERKSTFNVRGLGPGAIGVRVVQRVGHKRIYSTYVDFQIDRLLGEAIVTRGDAASADAQAVSIARVLSGRIIAFAQGTLSAQPVTLPRPLGTRKPGKSAPDLEAMVVATEDLKGKGGVFDQSFQPDDNAIASYVREFRFGPGTGLFQLRSTAALERTRREASGRMLILRSIFTGPEGPATLAGLISPNATGVKLDAARGAGVGEESFSVSVSFTAQAQRFRAVLVYERRERIVGSVLLVGDFNKLTPGGVAPYADALDKRIKQTLKPKPPLVA